MAIVCATHFTASSLDAVQVATALAARTRQTLHLVAVMPAGAPLDVDRASRAALQAEAVAAAGQNVEVKTTLLHGRLEQQLAIYCREVSA